MDGNESEADTKTAAAQKEFDLIADLLRVPEDSRPPLPVRRQWKSECVGLPDLVVVDRGALCKRNDAGELLVTVRNQGSISALATVTRVVYPQREREVEVPTPSLAPGEEVTLPVEFLRSQSGSDGSSTDFTIIVDARNELLEFNKQNNTAKGNCFDRQ